METATEQVIQIPFNYKPRAYQLPLLQAMDNGYKRAICIWHRRAGKDKTLLNFMIKKMVEKPGIYYYFFPEYSQGKKVIWDGIDKNGFRFLDHFPKQLVTGMNSQEMKITLKNGSVFQIIGTDNFDSIRGTNPVGCIFSEYAFQNPRAWATIRPILRENGGWAIFNTTPFGQNHAYDMYFMAKDNPEWFSQLLTVDDTKDEWGNPLVSAMDIEEERRSGMTEDDIAREYYCSFSAAVEGSYFGPQLRAAEEQGRICAVPHDAATVVHTAWDLGMNDSMTVWLFQVCGREIHLINFFLGSGEGLQYYINELKAYSKQYGYIYGDHYMPHDIDVREIGAVNGRSRKSTAQALGLTNIITVPRVSDKNNAINAARNIFSRCWIDREKCKIGLNGLRSYRKKFDEKNKVFMNTPNHDWASHISDAFLTLACGFQEEEREENFHIPINMDPY